MLVLKSARAFLRAVPKRSKESICCLCDDVLYSTKNPVTARSGMNGSRLDRTEVVLLVVPGHFRDLDRDRHIPIIHRLNKTRRN